MKCCALLSVAWYLSSFVTPRRSFHPSALHLRYAVVIEQTVNVIFAPVEYLVEFVVKLLLAAPDGQRDVIDERQKRLIDLRCDGHNGKRHAGTFSDITGERPPDDGRINLSARDRINNRRLRIRRRVVAVDHEALHVLDDVPVGERVRGRRVGKMVADHLHTDLQLAQTRVVERRKRKVAIFAIDEDVS